METPRLPARLEFGALRLSCALPSRLQRALFGPPPRLDGQVLASDLQAFLALARRVGIRSVTNGLPPAAAQQFNRRNVIATQPARPQPPVRVEAGAIPGRAGPLASRFYLPAAPPAGAPPLLVYFHGGGWVIGDLDSHDSVCRLLAAAAGVAVLSVDYRLAPAHPFPAAYEDALDAFAWAAANAAQLGADPARVAVGGDSAGGNLAGAVALAARAGELPPPALQLLIHPITDCAGDGAGRRRCPDGFLLTKGDMDSFERHYLPAGSDRADPRVSILRAPELAGLAPAYLATTGFEVLREEGEAYARRLRAAGVRVALRRFPGLVHSFPNLAAVSRSARAAMFEVAGALRMGLAAAGP